MRDVPDRPPVNLDEFEALARQRLPEAVYDFFAGGAGDEWTLEENRRAYDRWAIRPRILRDRRWKPGDFLTAAGDGSASYATAVPNRISPAPASWPYRLRTSPAPRSRSA